LSSTGSEKRKKLYTRRGLENTIEDIEEFLLVSLDNHEQKEVVSKKNGGLRKKILLDQAKCSHYMKNSKNEEREARLDRENKDLGGAKLIEKTGGKTPR